MLRSIPNYAKGPDGEENWVQPAKDSERESYYKGRAKEVKGQSEVARKELKLEAINQINGEKTHIESVKKNPKMTLGYYLRDQVLKGDKNLMLQSLGHLQKQGYQVDFFPEGYTVEVIKNRLFIYKEDEGKKTYYVSPDTNVEAKDLEVLPIEESADTEPKSNPKPDPPLRIVTETITPFRETESQEIERNALGASIKAAISLLIQTDADLEAQGHSIEATLGKIKDGLEELKQKFPYDPDIYTFGEAYKDLQSDFERGEETNLDQSLTVLGQEMGKVIEKSGVKEVVIGGLNPAEEPALSKTTEQLKALNIEPSYVVKSPNPKAKTVVLFMQAHPKPMADLKDITLGPIDPQAMVLNRRVQSSESSQEQIVRAIVRSVQAGLVREIYDEGLAYGMTAKKTLGNLPPGVTLDNFVRALESNPELLKQIVQKLIEENKTNKDPLVAEALKVLKKNPERILDEFKHAALRAQEKLGDKVVIKGYDFDPLKLDFLKGKQQLFHRMSAHNAFIASNLADFVESSDADVSFATMGAAHEEMPNSNYKHPLPISHVLAYYGMNVIVVDTALEAEPKVR